MIDLTAAAHPVAPHAPQVAHAAILIGHMQHFLKTTAGLWIIVAILVVGVYCVVTPSRG